jgi:hypothetical protein
MVKVTPRTFYTGGGGGITPILQEAIWVSGPVVAGTENLTLSGIRSPKLPAPGESLYRLCTLAAAPSGCKKAICKRFYHYNVKPTLEPTRSAVGKFLVNSPWDKRCRSLNITTHLFLLSTLRIHKAVMLLFAWPLIKNRNIILIVVGRRDLLVFIKRRAYLRQNL